ncbi:secreted protein C isoform X2 [Paralichthys olivaceus]|uniref:secreted protein C isoform X2 n=1 Tax=Paralichthys olivaceus TaxID=8255 RepID=UPI0037523975
MLPPNLLMVSLVVFLAAAVSTAPVEEKEREEVELETTEEGDEELSEEEDDDDSKSQDKIEGILGVQQTTLASASGGSGSSVQSAGGASDATGSSAGSPGSAAAALGLSGASTGQSHAAGSDGVDSQSNGNGQKLLNGGGGGGGGGAAGQTGVLGSFGGGFSHLDYTGIIDPSNHDFVLGLMGEADSFSPEVHVNIPGFSSGVTAALSADHSSSSGLDLSTDHVHPAHVSIDQSGLDHSSLSSGPDQSLFSSVSGSSHSAAKEAGAASSSSSHSEDHREHTGNGRQTQLTDANGVTDRPVSLSDLQTDLIGGAESVTGHIDLTGLGLGHDVTGIYSHTDLVTAATDSTGLVSADPTGTGSPSDSSHPAVTDHTQVAGSVTEQYNPSGQGPEGAENVELEDTC